MNLTFRGIGFTPTDEDREFLDKKLKKLSFADDYLHDLDIVATKESTGSGFQRAATLHVTWKKEKAVAQEASEHSEGIELLADKSQAAAKKEKEKTMKI